LVVDYMHQNITNLSFLHQVAEGTKIPERTIRRLIQDKYQVSPKKYLNLLRLNEVRKELLLDKSEKKKEKSKEKPFENTRETLTEVITDSGKEKNIIVQLDELVSDMDKLQTGINGIFVNHKDIIGQKDASKSDLEILSKSINKVRKEFYDELTSFHFALKENTNDEEWNTIIKTFNKELSLMNK